MEWTDADSVYGSKQLAKQWSGDGTAAKIKAFLLLDMIGDKDLDMDRDTNSTPWLRRWCTGRRSGSGRRRISPRAATPSRTIIFLSVRWQFRSHDLIDLDYGFDNLYHHTTQDTPDKCSAASLQIVGDIVMETIRALNTR